MRVLSLLMALGLVAGCDESSAELVVQLRTDYSPGAEFAVVRVNVERDGERVAREETVAERGADFLAGVPVAEVGGLTPGTYLVRTQLLVSGGEMRAAQQTRVTVAEGRVGATVLITRDCEGITCPLGDDPPALLACRGGTCVDPQCTEETPEVCPDAECSADGDCPAPGAPCGHAVCVSGVCLSAGDDAACASGEYCDPVMGCRPPSVPIPDSSVPDAAPGELGAPCTEADACTSGYCVAGVCCASACDDPPGRCFVNEGTCTDGVTCAYAPRDVDVPCEGDNEECTSSSCDGAGACVDTPMPDDSPCSVGTCQAGCCRPSGTTGCQIFHESGSFTVPAGVTALRVRAWGGGGGGGEITDADGGQGGAGGYVESTITVTPDQVVDVYVGGGGRSGTCGGGGGSGASLGGDGGATNGTGGIGNGLASGGEGGAGQGTGGRGGRAGYAGGGGGGGDSSRGGGGGGASEIQLIPGFSDLVAGGGGGGGGSDHSRGGHGGAACDLDGEAAPDPTDDTGGGGGGGTCIGDTLSSGSGRAPPEEAASAGAGIGGSGGRACWSSNGRPGKVIITY